VLQSEHVSALLPIEPGGTLAHKLPELQRATLRHYLPSQTDVTPQLLTRSKALYSGLCLMSGAGNGAPVLGGAEIASGQKQSEHAMMDGLSSSKVTGIRVLTTQLTKQKY
jgi:hypothetical protein